MYRRRGPGAGFRYHGLLQAQGTRMTTGTGEDDPDRTELLATRSPGQPVQAGEGLPAGTRLGRYRIEALLGQGGMGEVYRAEQLEPVRRTVALKLLRAHRLDARHMAYFEVERQVLAQMRHPAIAQIYDAGATADGHPFFAMEFIDGAPVTHWCEAHALPLAQRIELFILACEGVQHAHQKGVIHRDLKPGNLLVDEVDGRPHPKIIDFGIATVSSLGEARDVAGTPDYMSPEQATGDPALVDTRSDVYSLGVVLHELLTGRRPASAGETVTAHSHTLRRASEQLDTLAPDDADRLARGQGQPLGAMRRLLRDELDWVVLKAMRHDRNERYASAAALADDLRRFLDGRPLLAVPRSRRYEWRKFAARHRTGLVAAGIAVAALLGGLAMSVHGLMQARAQRAIAEQRSQELERVAAFQQSMLEDLDIEGMGLGLAADLRAQVARTSPESVPALEQVLAKASTADLARALVERDILGRAETAIDRDFHDQPALASDLREAAGSVHDALGMYAKASELFAAVAAQRSATLGARDPQTLRARLEQGSALQKLSRNGEARQVLEAALADAATLPEGDPIRIRLALALGEVEVQEGDLPAARARSQALLERTQAARGADDLLTSQVKQTLAMVLARTGELTEARVLMEQVVPLRTRLLGETHPDTLAAMGALATMRAMLSDYEPAAELQRKLVQALTRRLGLEHPDTLAARGNLSNMLSGMGQNVPALAEAKAVFEARTRVLGAEHPQTLRSALNLSSLLAREDRFDEALPLEAQVLAARRRLLGPDHPDTLFIQINHGVSLQRAGQSAQALALLDDGLPRALRVLGEKHHQYQLGLMMSGQALLASGRVARGIEVLARALALRKASLPPDSPEIPNTAWALVKALRGAGRDAEAQAVLTQDVAPLLAAAPDTLSAALRGRREQIETQIRDGDDGRRRSRQ